MRKESEIKHGDQKPNPEALSYWQEISLILVPANVKLNQIEGEAKALSWDCPFLETSAKDGDNVDKAFEELTKLCLTYREKEKSVGKRKRKIRCVVL